MLSFLIPLKHQRYYTSQCNFQYLISSQFLHGEGFPRCTTPARQQPSHSYSSITSNEVCMPSSRWLILLQNPILESASLKHSWYKLSYIGFLRNRLWDGDCGLLGSPLEGYTHKGVRQDWSEGGVDEGMWGHWRPQPLLWGAPQMGWPFRVVSNWGKGAWFLHPQVSHSMAAGYSFTMRSFLRAIPNEKCGYEPSVLDDSSSWGWWCWPRRGELVEGPQCSRWLTIGQWELFV